MKNKFFFAIAMIGIVALVTLKSKVSSQNDVTLANISCLANAQAEGYTGPTGPAVYGDCGFGLGTYIDCVNTTPYPCTPKNCSY